MLSDVSAGWQTTITGSVRPLEDEALAEEAFRTLTGGVMYLRFGDNLLQGPLRSSKYELPPHVETRDGDTCNTSDNGSICSNGFPALPKLIVGGIVVA